MPFEGLDDRLSLSLSAVVVVKTRSNVSLQHDGQCLVCSRCYGRHAFLRMDCSFFLARGDSVQSQKGCDDNNNDATDDTVSTGTKDSIWSKRKMQTYDPTNGHGSYDPTGTFVMKLPGAGLEPGRRWI